jgi:hypothetical protein
MKKLVLTALMLTSFPALACFDRNSTPLSNEAIQAYANNPSAFGFRACLDKLADEGVDIREVKGARKNREDGDTGPVIYTIMVQGRDSDNRLTRIYAKYSLRTHGFSCEKPTRNIPKCF